MGLRFEWDSGKATRNLRKHRVAFDEAATVFADPLAAIFDDEEHSDTESREIVIGHSVLGRLLVVSFVQASHGAVRIISARTATRTERREYEENRSK
jgi:uncharacterized DUF497 family protein